MTTTPYDAYLAQVRVLAALPAESAALRAELESEHKRAVRLARDTTPRAREARDAALVRTDQRVAEVRALLNNLPNAPALSDPVPEIPVTTVVTKALLREQEAQLAVAVEELHAAIERERQRRELERHTRTAETSEETEHNSRHRQLVALTVAVVILLVLIIALTMFI